MKRGNLRGVSESVLRSLARTLHMDEAETQHLFDLARAASDGTRARRAKPQPTRLPQRATHPATELNMLNLTGNRPGRVQLRRQPPAAAAQQHPTPERRLSVQVPEDVQLERFQR
jgi:hypothetical protein